MLRRKTILEVLRVKSADSKPRLTTLKRQVKYLKKVLVLSIFESKEDMKEFCSDIW